MGSYYNIITKYENAIYERSEDNHYVVQIKDIDGTDLVDPSSVSISISDQCGNTLVDGVSMVSSSEGVYYYTYSIPADATYGEYNVSVVASSPTITAIYRDKFYILPWNAIYSVRRYSGITSKKSISDHDIAAIIWESYKIALDEVFEAHNGEAPDCNPDTGAWIDGSNKTFETKSSPLADSNGDGEVTGYMEKSCGTDVSGWWKDCDGDCHRLKITVNEPRCGNVTIEQLDGTALPSDLKWVRLDYKTEWRTYDSSIFRDAVAFLAAHECITRFKELDRATMADLHSNKTVILQDKKRMLKSYTRAMKKIKKPVIGAGMIPGED